MIPVPTKCDPSSHPQKKFKNISAHHNCDCGIHLPRVDGASPMWSHVEVLTKASVVKLQEREHLLQCWEDNFLEPGRPFLGTSLQRSIPHSHQHHQPLSVQYEKKLNFHQQLLFISFKNNSERPVDALAVKFEKGESLTHSLSDILKSGDASASNKSSESGKSGRWHIQAHSGSRTGLTTSATAPQSPKLPRHDLRNQLNNKI